VDQGINEGIGETLGGFEEALLLLFAAGAAPPSHLHPRRPVNHDSAPTAPNTITSVRQADLARIILDRERAQGHDAQQPQQQQQVAGASSQQPASIGSGSVRCHQHFAAAAKQFDPSRVAGLWGSAAPAAHPRGQTLPNSSAQVATVQLTSAACQADERVDQAYAQQANHHHQQQQQQQQQPSYVSYQEEQRQAREAKQRQYKVRQLAL
jgi:hypothetical protein